MHPLVLDKERSPARYKLGLIQALAFSPDAALLSTQSPKSNMSEAESYARRESSAGSHRAVGQAKLAGRLVDLIKNHTVRLGAATDERAKSSLATGLLENIAALFSTGRGEEVGEGGDSVQEYAKLTLKRQDLVKDALIAITTHCTMQSQSCISAFEKYDLLPLVSHLEIAAPADMSPDGSGVEEDTRSSWTSASSQISSLGSSMVVLQNLVQTMSNDVSSSIQDFASEMRALPLEVQTVRDELNEVRSSIARLTEVVISIGHGFEKMKPRTKGKETAQTEDRSARTDATNRGLVAEGSRKRPASSAPETSTSQGASKRFHG